MPEATDSARFKVPGPGPNVQGPKEPVLKVSVLLVRVPYVAVPLLIIPGAAPGLKSRKRRGFLKVSTGSESAGPEDAGA